MRSRNNIILFVLFSIFINILKMPFINSINDSSFIELLYNYFILFEDNQFVNSIWFSQIIVQVFFISKEVYIALFHFNLRYKNRKNYFRKVGLYFIFNTLIYSSICLSIGFIFMLFQGKVSIVYNTQILMFIVKYIIETSVLIIMIVSVGLLLRNYVYSFLVITMLALLLINVARIEYIPFVTIYANTNINYISLVIMLKLIPILYHVYPKIDERGGETNEIRN
jgi:hypothetical protein